MDPADHSPLVTGDVRGWQLFVFSFVGLANTEALFSNIGMYLLTASGAAANMLLFGGWLAGWVRARKRTRSAMADAGVALALGSLTQKPGENWRLGIGRAWDRPSFCSSPHHEETYALKPGTTFIEKR